jgi:uncharacterized protein YkwD
MPVRTLVSSFLLAAALLFAAAPAQAKTHKATAASTIECANTDITPNASNLETVRDALLCLHNEVRAEHHLRPLKNNAKLAKAGDAHSDDMVANAYFDHDAPSGQDFVDRIVHAGYVKRNDGWSLGENLAWGTGGLSSPAGLMRSWMASPGHRANILKGGYRELGLGFTLGTPTGRSTGITVSAEFGAKR